MAVAEALRAWWVRVGPRLWTERHGEKGLVNKEQKEVVAVGEGRKTEQEETEEEEEEEEEEQQQQVVLVLVVEAKRSRSRLRLLASGCAWERKRVDVSVGCSSGLGFRV